jgi:dolichol-phosphate mannosyltransferase
VLPELSVIVPVRNEESNVAPLVREIVAALTGRFDFEIIYINDGSTDDTAQVLRELRAEVPQLRFLTHTRACGQSAAVHSGVCYARKPWIGVLDGDGQNDPADLPHLWTWISSQPQGPLVAPVMAIGRRARRQDSLWRKFCSDTARRARKVILGDAVPDSGCGIKILHRDLFLSLPYFDHMHRFMPSLILRAGGKVASIPVNHRARTAGRSKYGTLDRALAGVWDLVGVMWLQHRYKLRDVREESV